MDQENSSTLEFEKICLAGEESSDDADEELETSKTSQPRSQLMLCDHCDQHVSRATFYRHQSEPRSEQHFVDSEEEQFDPMRCSLGFSSEQFPDNFSDVLGLLELGLNYQQIGVECDDNAACSVDEDNIMDEDSESVSSVL